MAAKHKRAKNGRPSRLAPSRLSLERLESRLMMHFGDLELMLAVDDSAEVDTSTALPVEQVEQADSVSCLASSPPSYAAEGEGLVAYRIAATDLEGNPLTKVQTGEVFRLSVFVQDKREVAWGVFSPYLDVIFEGSNVSTHGPLEFGQAYPNGRSGRVLSGGIDEVGGFGGMSRLLEDEYLVVSVLVSIDRAGTVAFRTGAPDFTPVHDLGVHGEDDALPMSVVEFGSIRVEAEGPDVTSSNTNEAAFEESDNPLDDVVSCSEKPSHHMHSPGENVDASLLPDLTDETWLPADDTSLPAASVDMVFNDASFVPLEISAAPAISYQITGQPGVLILPLIISSDFLDQSNQLVPSTSNEVELASNDESSSFNIVDPPAVGSNSGASSSSDSVANDQSDDELTDAYLDLVSQVDDLFMIWE